MAETEWAKWHRDGFNIGVHLGASRLICFDLDQKHGGIEAVRSRFDAWCLTNGMAPLPAHVTTPSGGEHVFMRVPEGVDAMSLVADLRGTIGKGVDVLVGDRQSVAPGSYFDGASSGKPSGYYTFHADAPLYEAPQAVMKFCTRAPVESAPVAKVGNYDRGDVGNLVKWLTERGEFDDYQPWVNCGMALKLEFGDNGRDLWALAHNDTVTPDVVESKWPSFDSEAKPGAFTIASLMKRAHDQGWKGSLRPSVSSMFAGVAQLATLSAIASPPLAPNVPLPQTDDADGLCFPESFGDDFRVPNYLVDEIFQRRFCYSMTAQTGTGKTAVALLFSAHVAPGRALSGRRVKPGWVLYLAGENPDDVQARWFGLTKEMGIDPKKTNVIFRYGAGNLSEKVASISRRLAERGIGLSLVVVDTAAAFFEGDNDNDNVQAGNHARFIRSLVGLPGEPTVLVLCHPTKNAKEIGDMVPRGGGAFIAEVDGNVALARAGGTIAMQTVGKFRGPEVTPIHFGLRVVRDHPRLIDEDGRPMPTVVAHEVSEAGVAARESESEKADVAFARYVGMNPGASLERIGTALGHNNKSQTKRQADRLVERKVLDRDKLTGKLSLTSATQISLNKLESEMKWSETNVLPFPGFPGPRTS